MAEAAAKQEPSQTISGAEPIEGGEVNPLEDYSFEEIQPNAPTGRMLAYILVGILGTTILLQYGLTFWLVLHDRESAVAALDKLFAVLLPVLSGLVGGAVIFVFTKEKEKT